MQSYVIFTDSGADIPPATLEGWGVRSVSLTFRFEGDDRERKDCEMPPREFYRRMRGGEIAKTAAVNIESFLSAFEEHLSSGHDILYIGFSSGLSSTYASGRKAAEMLLGKYPGRKIYTVDSLSASAGEGLLVRLACERRDGGATLEECAEYLEGVKRKIAHWFTVDDLVYLNRGGRISSATAFVGNALGIKPILHVNNEGRLVSVSRVRGRKKSLAALAEKYGRTAEHPERGPVYISCADCEEDARALAKMIGAYGAEVELITSVGPVIGSHAGPGTLALFFIGKER